MKFTLLGAYRFNSFVHRRQQCVPHHWEGIVINYIFYCAMYIVYIIYIKYIYIYILCLVLSHVLLHCYRLDLYLVTLSPWYMVHCTSLPLCQSHTFRFCFVTYCFPKIKLVHGAVAFFSTTQGFATCFLLWKRTVSCSLVGRKNSTGYFSQFFCGKRVSIFPIMKENKRHLLLDIILAHHSFSNIAIIKCSYCKCYFG